MDVTTIVVRASLQQQAERAAIAADPAGAGTFVPGTGLRKAGDPTNTVVAYVSRWNMRAGQQAAFARALTGVPLITANQTPDPSRDRWMFDSNGASWPLHRVLEALGMETLIFEQ